MVPNCRDKSLDFVETIGVSQPGEVSPVSVRRYVSCRPVTLRGSFLHGKFRMEKEGASTTFFPPDTSSPFFRPSRVAINDAISRSTDYKVWRLVSVAYRPPNSYIYSQISTRRLKYTYHGIHARGTYLLVRGRTPLRNSSAPVSTD